MRVKISFITFGLFLLGIDKAICDVKSSLTFVIDDTFSMDNDIKQVKKGVNAIFDTVMRSNSSQIEDFVLVTFNDPATLNKVRAKTRDINVFNNALSSINVHGGGECPETAMAGIKMGLQNSREESSIYVFTDASADDYEMYDEVEALSQKMGCQIVFVLTGVCTTREDPKYKVYKDLARATNGQVFHLERDEIGKILIFVQNNAENRKNVLTSKTFPPGYGNTFNITADADTKELVISVSGLRPSISVTDSDGKKWPTTVITRLKEIAVEKVVDVTPNVYIVEVGSKDETHVVVRGSTTVHFQHGFSIINPSNIKDTVKRPVPDLTQHLSIKLSTAGDGEVKLTSVQLLGNNDQLIMETPLKLIDKTEQFYTTKPIMPPNQVFKVAIVGFDVNSNTTLTRVSLTPVKPQEIKKPDKVETKAPEVECKDKVIADYNKSVELKCKVSGYPKPDVIWESDDKSAVFSHVEYTRELPYDYISVLTINNIKKNAIYTCKAVNSVGSGEGSTTVQINYYFDEIKDAIPKDITVEYQKPVQIPCKANAYPPATASWFRVQHTNMLSVVPDGNLELSADGSILTIRSMQPSMADNYICEVRNAMRRKIYKFKLDISGVEAPEIDKKISKITAIEHSVVGIHCIVTKGKPKPKINWYYKNTGASSFTKLYETTDTILISDVGASKAGSYRCMAENVVDWTIHDIDLIVEYEPSISGPRQSKLTTVLGKAVTLTCPAVGEPAPSITWKLNGVPVSSAVRHTVYADGTLSFYATSADEGDYECEVRNKHGVDRIKYELDIYVPVEIESPKNSFIELMEGTTMTLPCRADGAPKPTITWIYRSYDPKVRPSQFGPSDASGRLRYDRIQLRQSGEYTCVATNSGGSKNITYEVSVLAPPKIYYTAKEFQGVVGDMQLRIPCNATGNPKPDITWLAGGYPIASGTRWFDISAEGSLIIKNIDKASTGFYTCKASNTLQQTQEDFSVVVVEFPDPGFPTNEIKLKKGDSAMIPCSIPQRKTDRLLWFKDGRRLPSSDLALYDVTEADSGMYTCRVSSVDQPAQSGSTRVEVGFEPRFEYPDDDKELSFAYGEVATMDCTATGVPKPEVKWYHDGREIELKEYKYDLEMFNDYDKGRYTCVASNSYGSVQQEFVVSSFECLLDVTHDFNKNEPLMLTTYNKLANFKTSAGYMRIPKDESIKLVCPTRFQKIRARELTVTCENEQQFVHQSTGRRYTYNDLKCEDKWQPTVKKTGDSCTEGNSELFNVGYKIRGTIQTVYGVCLDRISKNPIYTKLDMQPTLANAVANNDTEWFNYGSPMDLDGLYDCTNQNTETSVILKREFHRGDGCCFAKRMLVNPLDVAPGLQGATYTHLNVAPHWGTCDSTNWEDVERRIRKLVASADRTLQVYTGSSYSLEMPDAYSRQRHVVLNSRGKDVEVPRYLWKIVQDASSGASLAIIQVNVPDLKLADARSYQLCKDVCKKVDWMQGSRWRIVNHGFTYCCSLPDFVRAFRMRGVFPGHNELLTAVSAMPDDHYLHAII